MAKGFRIQSRDLATGYRRSATWRSTCRETRYGRSAICSMSLTVSSRHVRRVDGACQMWLSGRRADIASRVGALARTVKGHFG